VQHLDWSDFSRVDEAFAAGADAAHRALPGLLDLLARRQRLAQAMDFTCSANEGSTR
jgi:hypothetical protein